MTDMAQQARPGRPRHAPASGAAGATPRQQILDAAAALFAERGFAATTTRLIAERVGIRQASLYYHFAGKDELLIELLTTSVRPSLEAVRRIEGLVPGGASPAAALYLLALADVETLSRTPHNIGTLYLLPEVQHERYDSFRAERQELQDAYGRLAARVAGPEVLAGAGARRLGELLIQVTEVVIQIRRAREPDSADAQAIAASCLRLCGCPQATIDQARAEAGELMPAAVNRPERSG
ncbi:TetR/AcrR family transcriptional regulator [Actinoplanes subtropicus]|uniref:TetR/AcrR family transcriptional regulator n=1 Tax=Actinoplanes subtropicus TaxID=543632 RepID=UPI0004C43DCB|nr:TetR/AcrR family transcriptional regulator [Actinoplanes subtropicus]